MEKHESTESKQNESEIKHSDEGGGQMVNKNDDSTDWNKQI